MTEPFRWEEPPPPSAEELAPKPVPLMDAFLTLLAERPGEWAVYREDWVPSSPKLLDKHQPQVEWVVRLNPPDMTKLSNPEPRIINGQQVHVRQPKLRRTHTVYGRLRVADGMELT